MGVQIAYYTKFVLPCFLVNGLIKLENMDGLTPGDGIHPGNSPSGSLHGDYDILKIPSNLLEYLKLNDWFNGLIRGIGDFIYSILKFFLDFMDDVFKALLNFDFGSIEVIKNMDIKITEIALAIMLLSVCVFVILNMVRGKNSMPMLYNICVATFLISAFVPLTNWMKDLKNASVVSVDYIMGTNQNENLSDTVFKANTIDLEQSIKTCQGDNVYACNIVYLDLASRAEYIDYGLTLDSDIIGDKVGSYSYVNGEEKITREELSDGVMGWGKQRFYAYHINYMAINLTCMALLFVYFLGMFKMSYLISEQIQIVLTAKFVIGFSVDNIKRIGTVFTSFFKNMVGQVLVYFTMCFFGIITSTMGGNRLTGNWFADAFIIVGIGLTFLVGSSYLNNALGIDDGSGFIMKSMFALGRLGKMFKPLKRGMNKVGKELDGLKESNDLAKTNQDEFGFDEDTFGKAMEQSKQEQEIADSQGDIPEEERRYKDGTVMSDDDYQDMKRSDPNYVGKWHERQDYKEMKEADRKAHRDQLAQEKEEQYMSHRDNVIEDQRAMDQFRKDRWDKDKNLDSFSDLKLNPDYNKRLEKHPELEYREPPRNMKELEKFTPEEQEIFKRGQWKSYENYRVQEDYEELCKKEPYESKKPSMVMDKTGEVLDIDLTGEEFLSFTKSMPKQELFEMNSNEELYQKYAKSKGGKLR